MCHYVTMQIEVFEMETQAVALKKLYLSGELMVQELRDMLLPYVRDHRCLTFKKGTVTVCMFIEEVMLIYKGFHQLSRSTSWGEIPVSCTRVIWGVTQDWIAATASRRKLCKSIKSIASRRCLRIMEESKSDDKEV